MPKHPEFKQQVYSAIIMPIPSISIIIVTYNSAGSLRPTLEAVFAQDYPDYEVILVDNASTDQSLEIAHEFESKGLRIIANQVNRGFAGGNNDGVRVSHGAIVFLLNPDAILEPDGLFEISSAFEHRYDAGILGGKLLAEDNRTLLHCGGVVGLPAHCSLHGRGELDHGQWDKVMSVDFVIGAALAIPRGLWDRLGGFDEDFNPAFYEDTDLCTRCRRIGKKVLYWPKLRLIHPERVSSQHHHPGFWWMHHRNRLWFTAKNHSFGELLFLAFPAEMKWYFSPDSAGLKYFMLKVYWAVFKLYLKRKILRMRG